MCVTKEERFELDSYDQMKHRRN